MQLTLLLLAALVTFLTNPAKQYLSTTFHGRPSTKDNQVLIASTNSSDGWSTDDLAFLWREWDPVQVVKNLHLSRFTLEKLFNDYCNGKINTAEDDGCLKVDSVFKRGLVYYLIQIYIPISLIVMVSWVSFWLDQRAVPARVSLCVVTLVTMVTQSSKLTDLKIEEFRTESYIKAIDVWVGVCLMFVLFALLEFFFVNYSLRAEIEMKRMRWIFALTNSIDAASELLDAESFAEFNMNLPIRNGMLNPTRRCEIHQRPLRRNGCRLCIINIFKRSKRIDVISRVMFPLLFLLFNLAFWSSYMCRGGKHKE